MEEKDVRYESRHVADARHDARDHPPSKVGSVQSCGLVDDRANAMCLHDTPDEEGDASCRGHDRLDSEEMANLVNREPDCGQGYQPK